MPSTIAYVAAGTLALCASCGYAFNGDPAPAASNSSAGGMAPTTTSDGGTGAGDVGGMMQGGGGGLAGMGGMGGMGGGTTAMGGGGMGGMPVVQVLVAPADFVFTSADAAAVNGAPENTANGSSANTTWPNGDGVTYSTSSLPVTFRYDFTQPVVIVDKFYLWNGWDIQGQAIGNFSLTFYDASSAVIGLVYLGSGIAGINDMTFDMGATYPNVSWVELTVTTDFSGQIEFREIGFEGY